MVSPQRQASSGSGSGSDLGPRNAGPDDRKRKRMESNRLSAQRSRMKKQKQMGDLLGQVTQLQKANAEIAARISATSQRYAEVESRNNVLRAQMMELTDRLRSLNSLLQIVEEVSGLVLDIPEIPEPLMEHPWQLPIPIQPILANVDMFDC